MAKKATIITLLALAIVSLFIMPSALVSAVPAEPDSETGNDFAWIVDTTYLDTRYLRIGYTHWDVSSFSIALKDPSGTTKQSWTPARNVGSINYLNYSLDGAVAGDWHLYWLSTTSGDGWDHAAVHYLIFDYDSAFESFNNDSTKRVGAFKTYDCTSGKVAFGVSFDITEYDDSPHRALEIRLSTHFEDLNSPIENNIVNGVQIYMDKTIWNTSSYNAGGTYGTTYGSADSKYYSGIDVISVDNDDAGSDDLTYAEAEIDLGAVAGFVVANALAAVLTAGQFTWITGVGYAFGLAYDLYGPDLTTDSYRPDDAPYSSSDNYASIDWTVKDYPDDTTAFNTTTYNWLNMRLGGDTSYCFRFQIDGLYDYNGAEWGHQMDDPGTWIYLCVCA